MTAENAKTLEKAVIASLAEDRVPNEEEILELARSLRKIPIYSVDDDEFEAVIKRLHARLRLSMGLGAIIAEDHTPWLSGRLPNIDPFYWKRYSSFLLQNDWGPQVVASLDKVTHELLDLLGNPESKDGWPRRGLVMGDVQSGKTSNYTGLICKAADAGYRLVILMTGTLESLRRQTQARLDYGFVGLDSSGIVNRARITKEVGVGRLDGTRAAGVFTSTQVDFKADRVNSLGFRLEAFREPVLLVVKKNKRILENLTGWLQTYNADNEGRIQAPLLVIDDEADNASVNTNPDSATAINKAIRQLLNIFPKSSYVGFTATPFANVFIDPDTEDEMVGNDLFPRDFIYALDPPSNYVGAHTIFGDNPPDCLRDIDDAAAVFPRGHKSDHVVSELPITMLEAIRTFVVANSILDLRQSPVKHRSMLVNVSHYTLVQDKVAGFVTTYLNQLREDVRNYSKLPPKEALRNATLAALHETWKSEFADAGESWEKVQANLAQASLPIEVRPVNKNTGAASLDYTPYKDTGLRVIAIGGNSLARGLTLEGLCVSYFFRSTQMYDALLQMGRWFGYRDGYSDLCRIWMAPGAQLWYQHITEATNELRAEIRKMQLARLKPIDFGLKVRAHPNALLITARNKMRYSEVVEKIVSVSGQSLETFRLLSDDSAIKGNAAAARRFVRAIQDEGYPRREQPGRNPLWTGIPKALVCDFIRRFASHPLMISFQPHDLADFIEGTNDEQLRHWDVVMTMVGFLIEREIDR